MAAQGDATSGSTVSSLMAVMGSTSQLFNHPKLRSMNVYFGVGEKKTLYLEKSPTLLLARLKHNASFFYLNYFMITAVLSCFALVLVAPSAIIGIGLLKFAWTYVIRRSSTGSLKLGVITISQTHATIGIGVVSLFALLYLRSGIFWWTLFSSGFLVAVHAGLRDVSMYQEGFNKVDMEEAISPSSHELPGMQVATTTQDEEKVQSGKQDV